jgi:phage terminase Nu1 subunit (DNA packaging protein)
MSKDEITVTGAELATYLGITVARVDQLRREGTLAKTGRRYDLRRSVQAYCERLRESAAGRQGESDGDKLDPVYEKAAKDRVERQLKEIQLAKARGEVMQSSEILAVMQTVMGAVRARILSLPNRLPTMIHGMTKEHVEIVKREVYDILNRLVADGSVVLKDLQNKAIEDSSESTATGKPHGRKAA